MRKFLWKVKTVLLTTLPLNASKLNDGAAALVLMAEEVAESKDITPLATLVCQTQAAGAPEWFTTAPATAIARVFERTQLGKGDIDLFEINEAFSVVALAVKDRLGLDLEKINVHGGAVALGHPIGASGARILTTLLYAMEDRQARRGIASLRFLRFVFPYIFYRRHTQNKVSKNYSDYN